MGLLDRFRQPRTEGDRHERIREVVAGIYPDAKSVYWSSIGCCPTCDALDTAGVYWLPFDPDSPLLFPSDGEPHDDMGGPHPGCTREGGCICSPVIVHATEMPTHEPTRWSAWSADYIARNGHPLEAEFPGAGH
jgi:hypothetical protein